MAENKTQWQFPLLEVSENKRTGRSGISKGEAYELIGVDGSVEGGISPFPGFRTLCDLDPTLEVENPWDFNGSGAPPEHEWLSDTPANYFVDSFEAVTFRIGANSYGYGFVYRVRQGFDQGLDNPDGRDHYFIHYYINQGDTPYVRELSNYGVDNDDPTNPDAHESLGVSWGVVVQGRRVYLLVEGELPVLFWVDETVGAPTTYDENCVGGNGTGTTTGPGVQPVLTPHDKSSSIGSYTGTPTAPGTAQIVLTRLLPSELSVTWPGAQPQPDVDVRALEPGDYAFAYQLLDSNTGRKSKLSAIAPIQTADFDPNAQGGGLSPSSSATGDTTDDVSKYALIEIAWDLGKYDKMLLYRSVMTQKAGGTFVASILQLEGVIDLATYSVDPDPGGTTGHALYYYTLEDKALVWQETYLDARSEFDDEMPRAGAGIVYDGTLVLGKIKRRESESSVPANRGLGEVRYSSLADIGTELFPYINKLVPKVPSNQAIKFVQAGPNVIGFSRDRQYLIRREGLNLKAIEMHEGFGVVNRKAATSVGSLAYLVTEKGLKAVSTDGQLDDVRSFNHYLIKQWRESLLDSQVVFDSAAGVLCVHRPMTAVDDDDPDYDARIYGTEFGGLALIWFNTAKVTEVYDTPFWDSCEGEWPVGILLEEGEKAETDFDSALIQRAFFLQSFKTGATGIYRVHAIDYSGAKVVSEASTNNGEKRTTLLDITGGVRFTVATQGPVASNASGYVTLSGADPWGTGYEEAALYVLASTNYPQNIGKRTRVLSVTGPQLTVDNSTIFHVGDRVGLSPVYMRATLWQVGMQDEEGQDYGGRDFFRVRHVDAAGAAFVEVGGPQEGSVDAKVFFGMYKGNEEEPVFRNWGKDTSGVETVTVTDDEPVYYAVMSNSKGYDASSMFPFVEILCPDLEYRILSLRLTGKIRDSVRARD